MADKEKKAPAERPARSRKKSIPEADTARLFRTQSGDVAPVGDGARVEVVDQDGKRVREIALHPDVFGTRVNQHLLYEAVKQYRAGARRGTHMTKNRALVSGSGRKPWRQKGTGRARVGETRNPLWRHGGTVFGPVPRDYSYSVPKKTRLAALRSAPVAAGAGGRPQGGGPLRGGGAQDQGPEEPAGPLGGPPARRCWSTIARPTRWCSPDATSPASRSWTPRR